MTAYGVSAGLPKSMRSFEHPPQWLLLALLMIAGAASVFGFAPFGLSMLPPIALALLFLAWNHVESPRAAARLGFAFGVGLFGVGASWVFVALFRYGHMPAVLALTAVTLWVGYLALWSAMAGWIAVMLTPADSVCRLAACAGIWTLGEWLRGHGYIGFPWLALGYAQLPESPLAGYAPVGGVYLVSLASTSIAACLAWIIDGVAQSRKRVVVSSLLTSVAIAAGGWAFSKIAWTRPVGPALSVSLVQGNIDERIKFDRAFLERTFDIYRNLVAESVGQLVVLPESAFPGLEDKVPRAVLSDLSLVASVRDGLVLVGVFTTLPPLNKESTPRYYNSVIALGPSRETVYRKRHLVPFGESIPLGSLIAPLVNRFLAMPMADESSGAESQPPFELPGQHVAVNVCYEDAFGSELIGAARSAGILVNVTNDAWYGHSIAAWQHNQIAAMRALELGRPMLRATNTGITSAIGPDGHEFSRLPWYTRGVLEVQVTSRRGLTPYVRLGDWPVLALSIALLAMATLRGSIVRSLLPRPLEPSSRISDAG